MDIKDILKTVDHTLLKQTATWQDIKQILDDAMQFSVASACIPPYFVKQAKNYVDGNLPICTVIGFPNGYSSTAVKVFEAQQASADGADEIDMVINVGLVKSGNYQAVLEEIKAIREVAAGKVLKVIVETCFLTQEEKIKMCEVVSQSGADFIKTSTGFGSGGATFDDIALFAKHVSNGVKIKASGGISSLQDAERFIGLGANRLGTSRIITIVKQQGVN